MIRFILKRSRKHDSGYVEADFFTIDNDLEALERVLTMGGYGENTYDATSLVGVEVVMDKK